MEGCRSPYRNSDSCGIHEKQAICKRNNLYRALNDFSVWKVATDTMEKRRIRTMSIMISFKPAGLLHAPIVSIYECFLMLYNLSTYPQSIRIPSSNMFRKLTFPSSQVDCILSSKYTPYNSMFFSLVAKDSHEQRYHPYGSTNLSQNALEEKIGLFFKMT